MQTVPVNDIDSDGLTLDLSSHDRPWLGETVAKALRSDWHDDDEARFQATLYRNGSQVDLVGGLYVHQHCTCDRCLTDFVADQQIPIHMLLVPQAGRFDVDKDDEAADPADEDVSFGTYQGGIINLAGLVAEQIVLEQPMQVLCRPDCKGLCPACGKALNDGPCGCQKK